MSVSAEDEAGRAQRYWLRSPLSIQSYVKILKVKSEGWKYYEKVQRFYRLSLRAVCLTGDSMAAIHG